MTPTEMEKAIIEILNARRKTPDFIEGNSRLVEDVGLDSLALMEVIEEVQIKCNVALKPEDYSFETFASVESLVAVVKLRATVN
jgi:acyl carrier protein